MKTSTKVALAALGAIGVFMITRNAVAASIDAAFPPGLPNPPQPGGGSAGILATTGKQWVLTNKIAGKKDISATYGWHYVGQKFGGLAFEPSVSLPGVRVIQGIGTKHDRFHTDYSQTCVLAADACVYQGAPASLSTLLQDPIASSLISVEGPLQITRQPGVPQLDPIGPVSAGVLIERAQVAALPNDPLAREPILLGWVEQGLAEYAWSEITVGDLTFYVFSDALMFGGVRISVSATLQQQIADRLGCVLLTPRMADLVFQNASQVILPYPLPAGPTMASTAYMLNESDKITKAAGG